MTNRDAHEEALQDLAKDMVDASVKGLINIADNPKYLPGRESAERELFSNTLVNSMIYLARCGIKPYSDEKGPY